MEKIANSQLHNYLFDNKILHTSQYGFIKGKSNEMAIHELLLNISDSLDCDQRALAIFLDVAKAFDTVNHSLLLINLSLMDFHHKLLIFLHLIFLGDD